MLFLVVHAREDVIDGRALGGGVIFAGAGLEEDEAFCGMLD